MRSSNRTYLYPVDQLRAAAAILVVLYHSTQLISARQQLGTGFDPAHSWPYSSNPIKTIIFEGHTGVALFMVLSGFIFTVGTLGVDIAYWPFLRNRLLRIYPLYIAILLIATSTFTAAEFNLGDFTRMILPLGSFGGGSYGGAWGAMFWAVAVEVQFYLIFPLLLKLLNRVGPGALVRIIAVMVMLRALAWLLDPDIDMNILTYFTLAGRLDQFLLGMLAAVVFVRYRRLLTGWVLLVSIGGVIGALWMFNQLHGMASPGGWRVIWVDLEGALWACVIASYVSVLEMRKGWLARGVAAVGERSYSIYLLHFVIVSLVAYRWHLFVPVGGPVGGAFLTGLLVVLPITFLASMLSFAGVERPFLTLRGKYVRPAREEASAPVLASEVPPRDGQSGEPDR